MLHDELLRAMGKALTTREERLAVAESCTGGLIAARLTDIPGASAWFDWGVVTYANRAKVALLGVDPRLIEQHGAVSEEVALAMVTGLQRSAAVAWGVAVTGIAGPAGGTPAKPVGTVWLAWIGPNGPAEAEPFHFGGDRSAIRRQSVDAALLGLCQRLGVG